jgi:hypothetical protein
MKFVFNKDSQEKFDQDFGDVMSLNEFIECCEHNSFIDYDGHASEILLNGNIIYDKGFCPSDALKNKKKLLSLQTELGALEVVWYNK